jgi:hypothetical protein
VRYLLAQRRPAAWHRLACLSSGQDARGSSFSRAAFMRGVQFSNVKRVRRLGATPFVSIEVAVRTLLDEFKTHGDR